MAGKTKIEWTDFSSNLLAAFYEGKQGWFCDKPDKDGTCLNCYAESLNKVYGNGLDFDKQYRYQVEWRVRENEMQSLLRLNHKQPESVRNPGHPAMVFCGDMFDFWQPSIPADILNRCFDLFDKLENLSLQFQTTYPARMNHFFKERYSLKPPTHFWVGVSAGTRKWLKLAHPYLLEIEASVRYLSLEPLLEFIGVDECIQFEPMSEGHKLTFGLTEFRGVQWIILGGESGPGARACDVKNLRSIIRECEESDAKVFLKQLGARPINSDYCELAGQRDDDHKFGQYAPIDRRSLRIAEEMGKDEAFFKLVLLNDRKGGDPAEWPEDLRIREFPEAV